MFLLGAGSLPAPADDQSDNNRAADAGEPRDYLEIYKEFSGRCQGLRRGDIRMLRNTHPGKTIEYRMIRLLGGLRQASLIEDIIKPGDEGQKLGCEILDGREQTWEIVRARFVEPETKDGE